MAGGLALAVPGQAACDRHQLGEIPVAMKGLRPMVAAKINGSEAQLIFDTGGTTSLLMPGSDVKFGLTPKPPDARYTYRSSGRTVQVQMAEAKDFAVGGATYHHVEFPIPEGGFEAGVDGTFGQDRLGDADVEVDLAQGVVRLFAPKGCETADLAGWKDAQPISVIAIEPVTETAPRIFATATANGVPLRVLFDTGTARSTMTLDAAKKAGVNPQAAGTPPPEGSLGVGGGVPMAVWPARFDSFKIGDEEILGAVLQVVDKPNASADMLIGADFFLGHRVFISKSQRKLYFAPDNAGAAGPRPPPP
jgi:predicted aspartyl protease